MSAVAHVWGSTPEFVGPRHALRESLLLSLLLRGRPGSKILNAGAGQGTFTQLLEQHGFEVTSMDLSPPAVALLRDRVRGPVVAGDVVSMPFDDSEFDAVVLGEVLEHVVRDDEAMRETVRILKPHGLLAISVPADSLPLGPSAEWAGHVRHYSEQRLRELCELVGLRIEAFTAWGFPACSFYHRHLYEPRLIRRGAAGASQAPRLVRAVLNGVLQVDRLFVGVRRGAVGWLVLARRQSLH
jgi:ubiquinone/menaquinone biosynthesis C-methylase UbiE